MSYYTIEDDVTGYWDQRHIAWDQGWTEEQKRSHFLFKDAWFEERFAHLLPPTNATRVPVGRVLDLGCGCGMYSPGLLRRFQEYFGLDTSPKAIEISQRYFGGQVGFVASTLPEEGKLPYADGTFDLVMSVTVLQHQPVERRLELIQEIKRVLAPSGGYIGLEMIGDTQAFDMPPLPAEEWIESWKPYDIVHDVPDHHPEWAADNVWFTQK